MKDNAAMRSRFIALAAAAALFSSSALAAPVYLPTPPKTLGNNVAAVDQDGNTVRAIAPIVSLTDATGAAVGTSGSPLFTSSSSVPTGGSTAANQTAIQTPVAPATATATAGQLLGCNYYSSSGTTFTTNQQGAVACTVKGALFVNELDVNGTAGVNLTGGMKAVAMAPTTSSLAANTPSAGSAVASALILKASAGNLYGWRVVAGASAGFVMLFNATSAPADGAVTPLDCVPVAANAAVGAGPYDIPERYTTGITIVFSTTGCFTKTASATAYIRGTFQ